MKLDFTKYNLNFNHLLASALIIFAGVVCIYVQYTSPGLGFGGDSFFHYLFSKYSWFHPELFLDLWAKPVFTLISSPFAQLGFHSLETFNIACGLLTAFLLYKICHSLDMAMSWAIIPLTVFIPIYFYHLPSGYTEPLFGLVMAFTTYLIIKDYSLAGSIVASLLPFVRSEGFIIIPLLALVLLLKKRLRLLPFLLTGLVLLSLVGWPFKEELLWVFGNNPYHFDNAIYGSGSLVKFVNASPKIFGQPAIILFFTGLIYFLICFRNHPKQFLHSHLTHSVILLSGTAIIYFVAHSVLWGLGMFGSYGLNRVMVAIAPGIAFTGMLGIQGLNHLFKDISWRTSLLRIVTWGFVIWNMVLPFALKDFPVQIKKENQMVIKATQWLRDSEHYPSSPIYFMNSIVPVYLEQDPFKSEKVKNVETLNSEKPGQNMEKDAILIWDSHFGPLDSQLPKTLFIDDHHFKVVKHLQVNPKSKNSFEIIIFKRK